VKLTEFWPLPDDLQLSVNPFRTRSDLEAFDDEAADRKHRQTQSGPTDPGPGWEGRVQTSFEPVRTGFVDPDDEMTSKASEQHQV